MAIRMMNRRALTPALLLALWACAPAPAPHAAPLPPGATYVAMGSSFAAGPGVTVPADTPLNRCARSTDNYAHQLARRRNLHLIDVTCSGAATANLLSPWGDLPAQLDALTPDTALVTITIGGNDVGYLRGLMMASCQSGANNLPSFCRRPAQASAGAAPSGLLAAPTEEAWQQVEAGLDRISQEVRRRAPSARLIFVDYVGILPQHRLCDRTPLAPEAAITARATAARLAALTARAAERAGADLIKASDLSRGHDACAADPWVTGFIAPPGEMHFTPYHPNLAGMTAIANALDALVSH
jgi:lysophospholipase L1-like esterase